MSDQSPRRRLAGRAMIAAAVLALPLTASMSYAAADDAPQPPLAPEAPMPSHQNQIVIIEKHGGKHGDAGLTTRVVERGGKTIVFKTDRKLSEAEIDSRIDQALRRAPEAPEAPEPPMPPEAAQPPEAPQPPAPPTCCGPHVMKRIVIRTPDGDQTIDVPDAEKLSAEINAEVRRGMAEAARGRAEAARGLAEAEQGIATALAAIRETRSEIARDEDVPDSVRKRVLQQLDREIERLSRQGKS